MQYGIIYSVDYEERNDMIWPPRSQRRKWQRTEKGKSEEHENEGWKHEKFCALLETDKEFQEFIDHTCLHYDGTGTSVGSPAPFGFNNGFTPAFVFTYTGEGEELCAYVTPYPMPGENIAGLNTFKRLPLFGNKSFDKRDLKKVARHLLSLI